MTSKRWLKKVRQDGKVWEYVLYDDSPDKEQQIAGRVSYDVTCMGIVISLDGIGLVKYCRPKEANNEVMEDMLTIAKLVQKHSVRVG